ncbi:MAG TPA: MFS transporter [Minicystis sp.]|nr:MFS transporter [Minicystis sp.]
MAHAPADRASLSQWALALTATSTMAVSYVDRQTFAVLAPTVKHALGISDSAYGTLLAAFALAYLVAAPVAGRLVDALGARRGLLAAVLAWSAVAAAHALAPSFGALLALRVALGAAEAPSFPGAAQTVQRALPPSARSTGFGVLFSGSSVGAMIAPPLATALEARYGFRFAFVGSALVGLAWVPIWVLVAFSRSGRERLDAPRLAADPAPPLLDVILSPAVLRLVAIVIASAPFLNLVMNWGATYLVGDHGLSQHDVGYYLAFPPIVFDAGSIAFGKAASHLRARTDRPVPPWLVALASAMLLAGAAVPFAPGPLGAMLVASVAMAGGAGLYALGFVDALGRVPPRAVATVGGLGAAAQSIAQIVVNPLIGWSVESTHHYTRIFVLLGLWVLPGAGFWLAWNPRPPAVDRA